MAITTLNLRGINRSDTATSGQVITATSAVAADFQDAAGGGLIKIETKEFTSATATLDFDGCFTSTYDNYRMHGWVQNDSTSWYLECKQGHGATPTYLTAGYYNMMHYVHETTGHGYQWEGNADDYTISLSAGNTTLGFTIDFHNFGGLNGAYMNVINFVCGQASRGQDDRTEMLHGTGQTSDTNQPTSWRLEPSAGSFEEGCVTMYGVAK